MLPFLLSFVFLFVASEDSESFRQVQFNTIADIWLHYEFPEPEVDELVPLAYRREVIKLYFLGANPDMVSIAEGTLSEHEWLSSDPELSSGWFWYFAPFDGDVWCNWVRACGWEPNGVIVGLKRSRFDIPNSLFLTVPQVHGFKSGVAFAKSAVSGQYILFLAIHLDSDSVENRQNQVAAIKEFTTLFRPFFHIFFGGDMNSDANSNEGYNPFVDLRTKFTDSLHSLSPANDLPTCGTLQRLDGIFFHCARRFRSKEPCGVALAGGVSDNGVCNPTSPSFIPDIVGRFFYNFESVGSDHFPIWAEISVEATSSKHLPTDSLISHLLPTCQDGLSETASRTLSCQTMPTCGCGPCCAPSGSPCVPDNPATRGVYPTAECCTWLQEHFYTINGTASPVPGCPQA